MMIRARLREALKVMDHRLLRILGTVASGEHMGPVDRSARTRTVEGEDLARMIETALLIDIRRFYSPTEPRHMLHGVRPMPLHLYQACRRLAKGILRRI